MGSGLNGAAIALPLDEIVAGLRVARERWRTSQQRAQEVGGRELPSREALREIVDRLSGVLFPMRLGPPDLRHESEDYYIGHTLDAALQSRQSEQLAYWVARRKNRDRTAGPIGQRGGGDDAEPPVNGG